MYKNREFDALLKKGIELDQQGARSEKARIKKLCLSRALDYLKQAKEIENSQLVKKWLGTVYLHKSKAARALWYYKNALKETQAQNLKYELYHDIGNAYREMGKFKLAMDWYRKSAAHSPPQVKKFALLYDHFLITLTKNDHKKSLRLAEKLIKLLPERPKNPNEKKFRNFLEQKLRKIRVMTS